MTSALPAFSLEKPFINDAFLIRELGVSWQTKTESQLAAILDQAQLSKTVMIVSNAKLYEKLLKDARPKSVTVILLHDETYSPSNSKVLLRSEAVSSIIRNYGFAGANSREIIHSLLHMLKEASPNPRHIYLIAKVFVRGLRSRVRMRVWQRSNKRIEILPLGYTSLFAEAFANIFEIQGNKSILKSKTPIEQLRDIPISFIGAKGQIQRQLAIRKVRKVPGAKIELSESFNGASGGELGANSYVEILLRSKEVFCPPGFTNNESFRYYESLVCGAHPIEEKIALSHLGQNSFRASTGATLDEMRQIVIAQVEYCRNLIHDIPL